MPFTPYPDIDGLLSDLLDRVKQILGQNLVGLYLYGSLVTGDFDPEISDMDMLAVVSSDVDEAQFERLHAMHDGLEAENPRWKDRIEVQYVSTHALQTFRTEKSQIAALSPGEPFHFKDAGSEWLINWYIIRERGQVLYGPDPRTYIPPISKGEYLQTVREHATMWVEWLEQPQDQAWQAYVILTMCRILYAIRFGEQPSKREAALWMQREYPDWAGLVRKALVWRKGERDEGPAQQATWPETARFVRFVAGLVHNGSSFERSGCRTAP
jgi:predicted nucleotidyltransferase